MIFTVATDAKGKQKPQEKHRGTLVAVASEISGSGLNGLS